MTTNERGPVGDRSFETVRHRLGMALDETLETQRAIRRVLPDPVDDKIVLRCIELALQAPSGSNGQNWEFIVVKDTAVKASFAEQYRIAWAGRALRGDSRPGHRVPRTRCLRGRCAQSR